MRTGKKLKSESAKSKKISKLEIFEIARLENSQKVTGGGGTNGGGDTVWPTAPVK